MQAMTILSTSAVADQLSHLEVADSGRYRIVECSTYSVRGSECKIVKEYGDAGKCPSCRTFIFFPLYRIGTTVDPHPKPMDCGYKSETSPQMNRSMGRGKPPPVKCAADRISSF